MNDTWMMPHVAVLSASLFGHAVLGIVLGLVYFRGLWWSARQLADGRPWRRVAGLMLARFALLAIVLALVSREGARPLLAVALGLWLGRYVAVRHIRRMTP